MAQTIRLNDIDIAQAREAAAINSRSIASQISHWMKIGRIVEASPSFDIRRVQAALKAEIDVDSLSEEERVVFEEEFDAYMSSGFQNDASVTAAYAELGNDALAHGYDATGESEADLY